jgi:hypothetical protein
MVKRTVEDVEKLREQASFTFIFLNNYKLALMAVIPLFGQYSTASSSLTPDT